MKLLVECFDLFFIPPSSQPHLFGTFGIFVVGIVCSILLVQNTGVFGVFGASLYFHSKLNNTLPVSKFIKE